MTGIQALQGDIHVGGKPAYHIEERIGRGGSALCYLSRRILDDGSLGAYYVLKEFCPKAFEGRLVRSAQDGRLSLCGGSDMQEEFERLRTAFLSEASLCRTVNLAGGRGKSNFPWVLHCEAVPGRDDLLLIATEDGYTLADFIRAQRPSLLSRDYVLLCLLILSRLLEALRGVHRSVLHLDVSPKNVYLVTQAQHLSSDSTFSVKLFDLASARPKSAFSPETRDQAISDLACTEGFSDPALESLFDAVDERSDWYSAAACLYTLLTGRLLPSDDPEFFFVDLPRSGVLENDAFRSDLEALLGRALKLSQPFTEEDVAEDAFGHRVRELITQLRYMGVASIPKPPAGDGPPAVFPPEHPPLKDDVLRAFTPEERAAYDLQITLHAHRLSLSRDELDGFSCHSLPHIEEVMDETEKLYSALLPWLQATLPNENMDSIRDHLLLGAKFHDVGMAGSPEMRRLLKNIDAQFQLARGRNLQAEKSFPTLHEEMKTLARQLDMKTDGYAAAQYHSARFTSAYPMPKLQQALAIYHDEIKMEIRRRHADISGRYVMARREALAAHYGSDICWAEVALLAALHSGSASDPLVRQTGGERLSKAYMLAFLDSCSAGEDDAYIEAHWQRILMEATILRLADCRRSGSRMLMLDMSGLDVRRGRSGHLSLLVKENGVAKIPDFSSAYDILLSEKLVEFGGVTLDKDARGGWRMTHDFLLAHADTQAARELFVSHRIPSYLSELKSALLKPDHMQHVLRVRGLNADGEALDGAAVKKWLSGVNLEKGYTLEAQE